MLNIHNWRERIFFDENVLRQVNEFIDTLPEAERAIECKVRDFYLSFWSPAMLLDACKGSPENADKFIEKAEANKDIVAYTPERAVKAMMWSFMACETREQLRRVRALVKYAQEHGRIISTAPLWKAVFGDDWEYPEPPAELLPIDRGHQLSDLPVKETLVELVSDPSLISRFGNNLPGDYDIRVMHSEEIFGAWNPAFLTGREKDELVIYEQPSLCTEHEFLHTLLHEFYPGHRHFYKSVGLADQGAMTLVEGWATFVEWYCGEPEYCRALRNNTLYILSLRDKPEELYACRLAQGYGERNGNTHVMYATQYPGLYEAYTLGALWIEDYVARHKMLPKDFLNFLSGRHAGDFFALWG